MPRVIQTDVTEQIELAELVDMLETGHFDSRDEDNFASWGSELKKLGNNRRFLADLAIEELKQACRGQVHDNQFSAQVIMLHSASQRYYVRANFWPGATDSVIRHSGNDPFFYSVPHDHNFSFLTVGYFGPGYWSDYYEYEYGEVVGYTGEKVNLKFIEKARLEEGKVMLYRAHQDVHLQLPADALSISLNIVEASPSSVFRDQYRFNLANSTIEGILTRMSLEPMLALAVHLGGGAGEDLVTDFAARHPSERIRWHALSAHAGAAADIDARLGLLDAAAARDPSLLVGDMAKREIARLEAGRAWIEAAPSIEASQPAI